VHTIGVVYIEKKSIEHGVMVFSKISIIRVPSTSYALIFEFHQKFRPKFEGAVRLIY
jgi:hypothetical protein